MSFVFSIKDSYRQAVEAQTGGKNTVIYDDLGNPSVMVRIPKLYLDELIDGEDHVVHPAFLVDGVEKDEIFVSKYINMVHNNRAYSVPGVGPQALISFNNARDACFAKGPGWHLMTNAEWAAIAYWCLKNGFQPRGNNDYGRDHEAQYERAVYDPTRDEDRTLVGTGPASWNHDGTPAGIADLNGNVDEWVDGLKIIDGLIYVHQNNSYNTGNESGNTDGWVDTERYWDPIGGIITLNDELTNPETITGTDFKDIAVEDGVSVPDLLRHLAIHPPTDTSEIGGDSAYVNSDGERVPRRGGYWDDGSSAGVFRLYFLSLHTDTSTYVGFRSAYIPE